MDRIFLAKNIKPRSSDAALFPLFAGEMNDAEKTAETWRIPLTIVRLATRFLEGMAHLNIKTAVNMKGGTPAWFSYVPTKR